MGLLKRAQDNAASDIAGKVVDGMRPEDGKTHVALVHLTASPIAANFNGLDERFNSQANIIIDAVNESGREIVDLSVYPKQNGGYQMVIVYR